MASSAKGTGRKPLDEASPKAPRGRTKPVKRPAASKQGRAKTNKTAKTSDSKSPPKGKSTSKRAPARKAPAKKTSSKKTSSEKGSSRKTGDKPGEKKTATARRDLPEGSVAAAPARTFLARPATDGPVVTLGLAWFVVAVAGVLLGRWATLGLWGTIAAFATLQVGRTWSEQPRGEVMPAWAPPIAAVLAAACVAAASLGTALGGVALIALPLLLVVAVTFAGKKPAAASGAVIGLVLSAVPAMAVVLVQREGWQPALFLVAAVSFYDAGYFIGAAESSSRLEGPVTGTIGLLAVTFAASAFETAPFDRVTAWVAGAVLVLACPLGKMLVAAELPSPQSRVPAMRKLDSYLVAAPLMLAATWALS